MRAGQHEAGCTVIKDSCCPTCRVVAGRAVRRGECGSRSGVDGIVRLLPRRQMALRISATRWRDRQIVIVIDVAGRAGHVGVPGGERESRRAVIECCSCPTYGRVARRAIRRRECSARRRMHGARRCLPRGQVALRVAAIGRRDRQIVIIIYVAQRAGDVGMAIRQ